MTSNERQIILHDVDFLKVLMECVINNELIAEFDRLKGYNLSMSGTPIELMIDKATGREQEAVESFIDFVYEDIYLRLQN